MAISNMSSSQVEIYKSKSNTSSLPESSKKSCLDAQKTTEQIQTIVKNSLESFSHNAPSQAPSTKNFSKRKDRSKPLEKPLEAAIPVPIYEKFMGYLASTLPLEASKSLLDQMNSLKPTKGKEKSDSEEVSSSHTTFKNEEKGDSSEPAISESTYNDFIKTLASIFPPGEAESFLKEGVLKLQKSPSKITKHDFIDSKIPEYEAWLKKMLFEGTLGHIVSELDQDIENKFGVDFNVGNLKEEKQNELVSHMIKFSEETYGLKIDAFRNGKSLKEVYELRLSKMIDFQPDAPWDFDVDFEVYQASSNEAGLNPVDKRSYKIHARLQLKQSLKNHAEKNRENFDMIDEAYSLLNQIQGFIQISKELNKPIENLNENDLISFHDRLRQQKIDQDNKLKEEKANRIAEELLKELESESSHKSQSVKKKGKSTKKAASKKPVVKPTAKLKREVSTKKIEEPQSHFSKLNQVIIKLNDLKHPNSFRLHPRIKRWGINDWDKIRMFEDYDPVSRGYVRLYEQSSTQELSELRAFHRLAGIERVLSTPELREKYSYGYRYIPKGSDKVHDGRGLYCEAKIGKKKFQGIIYVGISADGVIYHAKFEPLARDKLLPSQMTKTLEGDLPGHEDEEKWELASNFSYNPLPNDGILFTVGKNSKDQAEFHIHSLQ